LDNNQDIKGGSFKEKKEITNGRHRHGDDR